jgi:hypothetical protein
MTSHRAGWRQARADPISLAMVRIAISQAAFDAIASTMPLGSVGFENQRDSNGDWFIWLPHDAIAKLKAMRGPGDSYSDAIMRLSEAHAGR